MKVIRVINSDGLLLCKLQAKAFELSCDVMETSSSIFIRRFMHSKVANIDLDKGAALERPTNEHDLLDEINQEYGLSQYGKLKFNKDELYWIGYIYRYFVYTYDITSRQAYKIIKPNELRKLYLAYHSFDPSQAIERILESKGLILSEEEELKKQLDLYKKIRMQD